MAGLYFEGTLGQHQRSREGSRGDSLRNRPWQSPSGRAWRATTIDGLGQALAMRRGQGRHDR